MEEVVDRSFHLIIPHQSKQTDTVQSVQSEFNDILLLFFSSSNIIAIQWLKA